MLLIFSYWLGMSLIGSIPIVGAVVGIALVPILSVSFYNIARDAERGLPITPAHLLSGFRENRPALLNLGGIYLLMMLAVFGFSWLADGGELAQFFIAGRRPEVDSLNGAVIAMLAYLPVVLAFWFAPALVAWQGMNAPQALFYSFFAALRNWRAMLLYALAIVAIIVATTLVMWTLVLVLAPTMLQGAATPPGRGSGPGAFLMFVLLPVILAGLAILFASFYASYRDVFSA